MLNSGQNSENLTPGGVYSRAKQYNVCCSNAINNMQVFELACMPLGIK